MGCNCGKRKTQPRRTPTKLPNHTLISSQNKRNAEAENIKSQSLNSNRRSVERKRREAIFKKLGRI
ncbi:MAG: hypothetical protein DWQ19_11920 [Crenarchaeota archaeon]|nr:MAG: hypothetical protein DWQ19_11920 [Thermoproteota archaeon]